MTRSTVVFDTSMSLDGYMTAANQTADEPMGAGGEQLVAWAFDDDPVNARYLADAIGELGAVIAGRRTYDSSVRWWGADGPSGPARRPVFVVTHEAPPTSPEGGVYTFVTTGIHDALARAHEAAGGRNVTVMGGAILGQQFLNAGLLDELSIHHVPIILGDGTRMFDDLTVGHVALEIVDLLTTSTAVHARYRIKR